ncbi:MAG: HAMP domain-containing histidine kinase [Proteobacteria bacterium]|jgi:signal transduction histidine kinase|nr:HAMP domain-containing histidine kinase [Pseudomonadota bacterium]MBK7116084.1 HAMP domain-containing histidine kinase [Pseudomonadota bacterium]MBK9251693.1 HAMP domain-containing histidine kinase [Pseudomonadota bacterium]MCC6630992.1 HAMP domain-containing histidine kinase [Gammaproteobacteria bacterium]
MQRSLNRSISVPIVLSSITVLMTLALLIGWIVVIREHLPLTDPFTINRWLLAGGIASFVLVMSVLVLFSVSLVGEILESRRQQMFIDSVTHELKSPLASIKLCLETMARPGVSVAQQDQLRGMMQSDVERLTVFVDDILQASRISHRRRSQTWTAVDVSRLVTQAAESIRARYHLPPEAFGLTIPPGVEIFSDPTALEIVLKNVFDNAVKYSGENPQVIVDMRQLDTGHIGITVQDHGIGISRNQLKRIFKRFHRAPDPRVNERSGSGLGLYVAYRLLRNLGGRIRAESEGPGKGTTMRIRLPKP